MTAVAIAPLATPLSGVVVNRANNHRSFGPAASRSASVMIFMPSKNNPIPPKVVSASDMVHSFAAENSAILPEYKD